MQPCRAIRPADRPTIGQNQEINSCSKRNATTSAFEIAGHRLWSRNTYRRQKSCVVMCEHRLQPFRPVKVVESSTHFLIRLKIFDFVDSALVKTSKSLAFGPSYGNQMATTFYDIWTRGLVRSFLAQPRRAHMPSAALKV